MKVLGLDLSSSTGISVFIDGELTDHTCIKEKVKGTYSSENYPFNYVSMAEILAKKIEACVITQKPDYVVIEETNKGKNRYSQKQLEFIHFQVAKTLKHVLDHSKLTFKVKYIDSSSWRSILGISLDGDQRKCNKAHKQSRDEKKAEISKVIYNDLSRQIKNEVEGLGKRDCNRIIKKWDKEISAMVSKKMRSIRSKIKKTDFKDLSVNYVNKAFNLKFKKVDNDRADAICLAHAFIINGYSSIFKK